MNPHYIARRGTAALLEMTTDEMAGLVKSALYEGWGYKSSVQTTRRRLIGPTMYTAELGGMVVQVCPSDEKKGRPGIAVLPVDSDFETVHGRRTAFNTLPLAALLDPEGLGQALLRISKSRSDFDAELSRRETTTRISANGLSFGIEISQMAAWTVHSGPQGRKLLEAMKPLGRIDVSVPPGTPAEEVREFARRVASVAKDPNVALDGLSELDVLDGGVTCGGERPASSGDAVLVKVSGEGLSPALIDLMEDRFVEMANHRAPAMSM